MKRISVIVFAILLTLGAAAQKRVVVVSPRPVIRPHVVYYSHPYFVRPYAFAPYSVGFGFGYNPFYYPGYAYNYRYYHPSKLDRQVQDIEQDYSDRIASVKMDDSLTHHEKRQKIRELKRERDNAIYDAKKNYYKQFENQ